MKVAHLTSVHTTFDTRIFHKQCRFLARAGHEVVLITPHEQNETREGVRIRALPFANNRIDRMTRTVWRIFRVALDERADLYHLHDPELLPIGLLLKLRGKRVVYDVHEDYPRDMLSKYYLPRPMRWIASIMVDAWERLASRCFDGVVVVFDGIAARFPAHKTVIVQNYPILDELTAPAATPLGARPNHVAYVGMITRVRAIQEIVQAMDLLPETLDVRLIAGGEFRPASLREEIERLPGWARVDFRGWLNREAVREVLGQVRAGLVIFHPEPNYLESNPNKLYEYMAAGIPFIASDFPRWRREVGAEQAGFFVDPRDPRTIADAIRRVMEYPEEAEDMGRRGRRAVETRFNWENEFRNLLALYDLLVSASRSGSS